MGGINYLFPPDQINHLPTWRFILHFPVGDDHDANRAKSAGDQLNTADFKIVDFPVGREPRHDTQTKSLDVFIEVTEEKRNAPNSLADYESDVWKILGNMAVCGYEEVFYEAVDWNEEPAKPAPKTKPWWRFW